MTPMEGLSDWSRRSLWKQIPEKSEYPEFMPGSVQEIALNNLFGIVVIIYNY